MSGKPTEDELVLIADAQHGNKHAFGELVRRHQKGVVNVVYQMCGDTDLAEDAAQEAFIRAWQHLPDYRPRSPFRNWLYRIAVNAAYDALRGEREAIDPETLALVSPEEGPSAVLERQERAEHVRRAVRALPPASRAVLVLREYEGLSYREIADTLDIPVGTVMSRLNYARRWLRQALSTYMEAL
jgi:RNA polymerase sigma-70 factor (ECF subfamily)